MVWVVSLTVHDSKPSQFPFFSVISIAYEVMVNSKDVISWLGKSTYIFSMDNKSQWIQNVYWGYDICNKLIRCDPNINQIININWKDMTILF